MASDEWVSPTKVFQHGTLGNRRGGAYGRSGCAPADQKVSDGHQPAIEPPAQGMHVLIILERHPGSVVELIRRRSLIEVHVTPEQKLPLGTIAGRDLADGGPCRPAGPAGQIVASAPSVRKGLAAGRGECVSALKGVDQLIDQPLSNPSLGIQRGIEDSHLQPENPVAGQRGAEDSCQLVPGEPIGEAIVDGRHDPVIEDVHIEMCPESVQGIVADTLERAVGGLVNTDSVDFRKLECERLERSRPPPNLVCISGTEEDNVSCVDQWPVVPEFAQGTGGKTSCVSELELRHLARRGLGFVAIGMSIDEQQTASTAKRQEAAEQDAAITPQQEREDAVLERVSNGDRQAVRVGLDRGFVVDMRRGAADGVVGGGRHAGELSATNSLRESFLDQCAAELFDTTRMQPEVRWCVHDADFSPTARHSCAS